jgi:hypothetical protein
MEDANGRTTARSQWRRRMALLRALAEDGDGQWSPAWDEALQFFGSELELLLAVHHRWQVHLLARLDQMIELGGDDPHGDVLRAVDELSRLLPGLAAVLRDHVDDPVLARAWARLAEHIELACPCGRPHPLVGGAARPRKRSRCVVVRRARAVAAGWRRRRDAGPSRARLVPRAV